MVKFCTDLFALLIASTTYLPNIYLAIYFASYFIIWESLYPYLGAFNFGCPPILEVIFPRYDPDSGTGIGNYWSNWQFLQIIIKKFMNFGCVIKFSCE